MDILEKPSYLSNEEMLERCLLLKKVLDAKIEKQIGRGKATKTVQVNRLRIGGRFNAAYTLLYAGTVD